MNLDIREISLAHSQMISVPTLITIISQKFLISSHECSYFIEKGIYRSNSRILPPLLRYAVSLNVVRYHRTMPVINEAANVFVMNLQIELIVIIVVDFDINKP